MVWGLDQRFRFFERFKNRAQHVLGLGTVTASLGRDVVASGAPHAHSAMLGQPPCAGQPGRMMLLPREPGALVAVPL